MKRINFFRAATVLAGIACHMACKSDPGSAPAGASSPAGQTASPPAPTPGSAPPHAGTANPAGAHGSAPAAGSGHALEKLPDGRSVLGPFSLQVPAGWTEKPSTSNMRAAEFQLPAPRAPKQK